MVKDEKRKKRIKRRAGYPVRQSMVEDEKKRKV
jgi:hypothetical protein